MRTSHNLAAFAAILSMGALAVPSALSAQGGGAAGIQVAPGAPCPSGTTLIRPGNCRAPDMAAPTILEYRPRSTLVTEENLVAGARFPVVDIHGHAQGLANPGVIDGMIPDLDALNIRIYVAADNLSGARLQSTLAAIAASPHRDRFRVLAGIDFRNVGPGWGERAVAQLEEDIQAGAIGVGEISKSFGMTTMKADGTRLRIDDPELDPVWLAMGRMGLPVLIHTAEPQEFFQALDFENERWLELALFPDRRNFSPGQATFEELVEQRDNLFRRHPETTFIAAHFGWHANDLERAAQMLDEFPNVMVEVGAVLYDLGRQPRAVREFFLRYQDRILFGKDAYQPSEYPYFWRVFETDDEYFDYYRGYHAFWKLYGVDLPDEVLRKLYFDNARRLFPGIPQEGWSQ